MAVLGVDRAKSALDCFMLDELPGEAAPVYESSGEFPLMRFLDGAREPVWLVCPSGRQEVPMLGLSGAELESACRTLLLLQAESRQSVLLESAWALFGSLDLTWRCWDPGGGAPVLALPSRELCGVSPRRGGLSNALLFTPHVVRLRTEHSAVLNAKGLGSLELLP